MRSTRLFSRARIFYMLDSLFRLLRLPFLVVLWLLEALYLLMCMVSWGIILWVLGEKHIGILKLLIFLCGIFIWGVFAFSVYSLWVWIT